MATMSHGIQVAELTGLWRRSLIAHRDGRRDTGTQVRWLQGPRSYVDLRQPADRPAFDGVSHVRDLRPHQIDWLATQLAFAGRLTCAGEVFSWNKTMDLHPIEPDLGRLLYDGETLVEQALDLAYVEHWHRETAVTVPIVEARLSDPDEGRSGVLVRVGERLGFARSRTTDLPPGETLADILAAQPTLRARQDLLDCEVSMATPDGGRWRITRSSSPWREGTTFVFESTAEGEMLFREQHPAGREVLWHWEILESTP
jgi:hypothetical protein